MSLEGQNNRTRLRYDTDVGANRQFKIIMIFMLKILAEKVNNMQDQMVNFSCDIETIKMNNSARNKAYSNRDEEYL